MNIIHEDPDLLVVNKPADLACHPTKSGPRSSLIGRVRTHLGEGLSPQLVNRLDRETSGLVFVAKHPASARALRRLWETRAVEKTYLAIVHGWMQGGEQTIDLPLGRDVRSAVAIKDAVRPDGAPAQTVLRVLRRFARGHEEFTLAQARPLTGRKHQLRIHLAHSGHPIVGDKLYGPDENLYLQFVARQLGPDQAQRLRFSNQALHCGAVRFTWRGQLREFLAEPEPWFSRFLNTGSLEG